MLVSPKRTAALATALAVGTLSACSIDSEAGSDTITVGTLRGQPHLFHPHFYEDFAPEGTEFEIVLFDSSPDIKNAVVSGSVDFGVAGVPAVVSGQAAGQDVVVVAAAADGGTGFVGREGIESTEDLAGLKVGYPLGASQEILLRLTLADAGLDPDTDVELVNLPFADMATALESGRIDAFLSAELGPSTALEAGAVPIASPYETPIGRVNIALHTTGAMIEDDHETVQAVVDTHIQATEFMAADTEAWSAAAVDTFGLDEGVVDSAIANTWPRWTIDDEYTAQTAALIEHMADLQQIETEPDVADVLDPTFVAAGEAADEQ